MDVKLPKLGEGADSGVVVSILVKEGDDIKEGQAIIELENEKAVASIPATASGKVTKLRVKEGDKVSVGQVLLTLGSERAAPAASPKDEPSTEAPKSQRKKSKSVEAGDEDEDGKEEEEEKKKDEEDERESEAPPKSGPEVMAAPSIRKLARELGIDLTRVRGSERGGRIVMADLRAWIQRLQKPASQPKGPATSAKAKIAPAEAIDFSKWGAISRKPLPQLRKVIGQRMSESWTNVPRVTQFDEADITALMELRKKHQAAYEAKGARLTLTPLVLKAAVATLKKHPIFNASLDEAAGEIVLKEYYHLGVAVDTDAGLLVPVIRDVDKKGLLDLAKEVEELAAKARERKLSLEEMKGGTFTISNQGGIGGAHFTPIVNLPEVAILGLGRGALKPVVKDKQIAQRLMLPLAISYDHRVIDGGVAARFTVDLVRALEEFREEDVAIKS
ncbi:MAG TPA: 2-oxo acid dehydrogenase subunit E2 [Verrucomicrobiae bacterium]|nr:2-oxo acid dehydrogenase subunit E2 [Verrucomicrobiae bacterium]